MALSYFRISGVLQSAWANQESTRAEGELLEEQA
jgi:hypothetical protein